MAETEHARYFTSYSGTKLPLKLVGELTADDMPNRNTYFLGTYNASQQLIRCEKIVYGEIEFRHHYRYDDSGQLAQAEIDNGDDEPTTLTFPA
ncbi:MAG: hypothetical protein D3M94_00575 [Rhodocyclales bacterium GT-UBC]|nr:MAG: hypothetical protein D3M94_00575 [Rhodocyclales bacterium GT-UBC]